MGHSNGTCNFSNLPIFEGNKIVIIPLIKVRDEANHQCHYPTDAFVPFSFHITGEYNGYGGVFDARTSKVNKNFLMSKSYYKRIGDHHTNSTYKQINTTSDFDEFINDVICKTENIYVKSDNNTNGYAQITFMMVHHDLFFDIISEIKERKNNCDKNTYEENLKEKYKALLTAHQDVIKKNQMIANDVKDKHKEVEYLIGLLKTNIRENIIHNIFYDGQKPFQSQHWEFFANTLIENFESSDEIINDTIIKNLLIIGMEDMRKGFLCDCGRGSQNDSMKLQLIIADFIHKFAAIHS